MVGHFVVAGFLLKRSGKMVHCRLQWLMMPARMVAAYAAVAGAIWSSGGVATVLTTDFYRMIFEAICSTTKRQFYDADIHASSSLISTLVIRFVVMRWATLYCAKQSVVSLKKSHGSPGRIL